MTIAIRLQDVVTYRTESDYEYTFHPRGWFPKLQQKLFDWALKKRIFRNTMMNKVAYYTIEENDLCEYVYKARDAAGIRDRNITHCYMGYQQFQELIGIRDAHEHGLVSFTMDGRDKEVLGYPVTVLPYMDGILFV